LTCFFKKWTAKIDFAPTVANVSFNIFERGGLEEISHGANSRAEQPGNTKPGDVIKANFRNIFKIRASPPVF
jgi:hypothetical protein